MKFSASLELLPKMLDEVNRELTVLKCSSKEHHQIELSVEEALVNVINYAYPEKSGEVEITCKSLTRHKIEILIRDWGIPFNPAHLVQDIQSDTPLEARKIGGLGVYFMYQLMDNVVYDRIDGANVLKMTKTLSSTAL